MMCGLSQLDSKKLETIKSMEQTMGKTLLAYTCHDLKPAALNEKELHEMQEMEKKLGVVLVAVKA
jgi:hypothetical protein